MQSPSMFVSALLFMVARPVLAADLCPAAPIAAETSAKQAIDAFAAMDVEGFERARDALEQQLGCLSAAPSPQQAGTLHLSLALGAFRARDDAATIAALRAAHEADPGLVLPPSVAPPGGPVQIRDAEALKQPPSPRAPHGLAATVVVDGAPSPALPTERPSVVVVLGPDGTPGWSGLLAPGQALPDLSPQVARADPGAARRALPPAPPERPAPGRRALPFFVAAGGSAVAAGVLGGLYLPARSQVLATGSLIASDAPEADWEEQFDHQLDADEVLALRGRARSLELGTQVAAGVALSLGVVGVVVLW